MLPPLDYRGGGHLVQQGRGRRPHRVAGSLPLLSSACFLSCCVCVRACMHACMRVLLWDLWFFSLGVCILDGEHKGH